MNITILTHLEREDDKKRDVVVDQVAKALKQGKHKISILGVHGDIGKLRTGLTRRKPDLVFNLMETFGENQLGAVGVVGFLDLMSLPYTGGGPGEFYIQEDKGLAKKLLAFDGVRYPEFAVFSQDAALETGGHLRLPLFVKPLRMDASIGIDGKSLVHSTGDMIDRVRHIHKTVHDSALVEEYIDGREFYVGVLGNAEPRPFPPIEMDFSGMPEGMAHVLDSKAKWSEKSHGVQGYAGRRGQGGGRLTRQAPEDGGRRLPRPARPRLRPDRHAPDGDGRRVRDRGQRQLLPGTDGRVRLVRGGGQHRLPDAHQPHRRSGM